MEEGLVNPLVDRAGSTERPVGVSIQSQLFDADSRGPIGLDLDHQGVDGVVNKGQLVLGEEPKAEVVLDPHLD